MAKIKDTVKKAITKKPTVKKKVETGEPRYIVCTKVTDTVRGTTTFHEERVAKV